MKRVDEVDEVAKAEEWRSCGGCERRTTCGSGSSVGGVVGVVLEGEVAHIWDVSFVISSHHLIIPEPGFTEPGTGEAAVAAACSGAVAAAAGVAEMWQVCGSYYGRCVGRCGRCGRCAAGTAGAAAVAAVAVSVRHVTWRFGTAWFGDDEMMYDEIKLYKIK